MKTKVKVLFSILILMFTLIVAVPKVSAASFHDDIVEEVETYVSQGKLESWHNEYSEDAGYQSLFTKTFKFSSSIDPFEIWGSYTESEMEQLIRMYWNKADNVWKDFNENLDIEPYNLEPNKIVGLYWDSSVSKKASFLYLIWTTEYMPTELVTLQEININNKVYKQYNSVQDEEDGISNWEESDYLHYSISNLTIHKTAISGFYDGEPYGGIPLQQKYDIKGFKAGVDKVQWFNDPDPEGKFSSVSDHEVEFDLGITPKLDGNKAFQLVTHAYEIIKDVEVQSHYDLGFGGYRHHAVFNTTIDIDKIYRVDVAYTLSSDNKKWYEFYLNTKEQDVTKSLTAKKISSGIFNLFNYQGFKEGNFKSNVKESKTYKYQLHLNYDDDSWNLFGSKPYYESDYKVIRNFEILRLNYLTDNKVYDVPVKMDTVDGETKGIVDRDLILDKDSSTWKSKDKVFDFFDEFSGELGKAKDIGVIVITALVGILILYTLFKIFKFINYIFKTKGKD